MTSLLTTAIDHAPFATLAQGWLLAGADSFSVWINGCPLAAWPAGRLAAAPSCVARFQIGLDAGELRLSGLNTEQTQHALQAEARLIAHLLRREQELDQMAAELIAAQDQLLAMYEMTRAARDHLGIDETLDRLSREAARLINAGGAVMYLLPVIGDYAPAGAGLPAEHFWHVHASGQEVLVESPERLPNGWNNLCVLPIRIRGAICAALGLFNRAGGFATPELKLARAIGDQAGIEIEHTLLHHETLRQARLQAEMEVARRVQLQLLPRECPRPAGLDVFAEARPALLVGGDFYDFIAETDQSLTLLLGDVAGKGISAALVMGMIHVIVRNITRTRPAPGPAAVIRQANEDLYDQFTSLETFATTFVAHYDAVSRRLRYANAGHAPVIYRPAGGPAQLLASDGVPLGVLPASLSQEYAIPFEPGAVLMIATDGFNEARNAAGELFGYERLFALLDRLAGLPAAAIARTCFLEVAEFSGGQPQDDDQTIMIVKGVVEPADKPEASWK